MADCQNKQDPERGGCNHSAEEGSDTTPRSNTSSPHTARQCHRCRCRYPRPPRQQYHQQSQSQSQSQSESESETEPNPGSDPELGESQSDQPWSCCGIPCCGLPLKKHRRKPDRYWWIMVIMHAVGLVIILVLLVLYATS